MTMMIQLCKGWKAHDSPIAAIAVSKLFKLLKLDGQLWSNRSSFLLSLTCTRLCTLHISCKRCQPPCHACSNICHACRLVLISTLSIARISITGP